MFQRFIFSYFSKAFKTIPAGHIDIDKDHIRICSLILLQHFHQLITIFHPFQAHRLFVILYGFFEKKKIIFVILGKKNSYVYGFLFAHFTKDMIISSYIKRNISKKIHIAVHCLYNIEKCNS